MSCFIRAGETCGLETDLANLAIESVGEVVLEDEVDAKLEKSDSVARTFKSRFLVVGRLGGSISRLCVVCEVSVGRDLDTKGLVSRVWQGVESKSVRANFRVGEPGGRRNPLGI
jgi:hypothetical protein